MTSPSRGALNGGGSGARRRVRQGAQTTGYDADEAKLRQTLTRFAAGTAAYVGATNDGAFAASPGLSGGAKKREPYSPSQHPSKLFSRGPGYFRTGNSRGVWKEARGASALNGPLAGEPEARPSPSSPERRVGGMRTGAAGDGYFSPISVLGPSESSFRSPGPQRGAGGTFRVGAAPDTFGRHPRHMNEADLPSKAKTTGDFSDSQRKLHKNKPFKGGGAPPSDFFDTSMTMSEPAGSLDESSDSVLRSPGFRPGPSWRDAGTKGGKPFGHFPRYMPDEYGAKAPVSGAEARYNGRLTTSPAGTRPYGIPQRAVDKVRSPDVYRTRAGGAAALQSSLGSTLKRAELGTTAAV